MCEDEFNMQHIRRRAFLKTAAAGLACAPAILKASAPRGTDIQIETVGIEFKEYQYRVPIKFGGVVSTHVVLLNVNCAVRSQGGKTFPGLRFDAAREHLVVSFPRSSVQRYAERDEYPGGAHFQAHR